MTATGDDLAQLIAAELDSPVPRGAQLVAERIRARHGDGVRAIVFYGSCLRTGDDEFSLLDLYVLVDSYWTLGTSRLYAALNALLPPNVYYTEFADGERTLRAKYAMVTVDDFARHTAARTFQPYFWGRFAQPCALVYAADAAAAQAVTDAFADAVTTFVRNALPLVAMPCAVRTLWTTQLRESYRAELRAERLDVAERLYDAATTRYERVTRAALARLPYTPTPDVIGGILQLPARPASPRAASLWRARRIWGKWLSLLRILKSALTQEGSVDYALWKVERHSGVQIDKTWRQKPHPLLALGEELWRIYRKGAFR